ncbi:MAG: YceK/YidQ family lipoprotein [Planctomycetaceae bacterium]
MRPFQILIAVSLTAVITSGCGTILNFTVWDIRNVRTQSSFEEGYHSAPQKIYGGVTTDAAWGKSILSEAVTNPDTANLPRDAWLGLHIWFVDLPLSAVADTLTLPLTIPATIKRAKNDPDAHQNPTPHPEEWQASLTFRI